MLQQFLVKVIKKRKNIEFFVRSILKSRFFFILRGLRNRESKPSKISFVLKEWKQRAFFTIETSLLKPQRLSSSSISQQSQCFLISRLFDTETTHHYLNVLIKKKGYKHLSFLGSHPRKIKLMHYLQKAFPELKMQSFENICPQFSEQIFDAVILTEFAKDGIDLLRKTLYGAGYSGDILIESKTHSCAIPLRQLEDPIPLVICVYPWAGTGRFLHGFLYLMEKLQRKNSLYSPTAKNVKHIASLQDPSITNKCLDTYVDSSFVARVNTLDYFECLTVHEYFTLSSLNNLHCKIIVLMRDPRDIINSFYWFSLNESPDKKNHICKILEGYRFIRGVNNAFMWPHVNRIIDNYLFALSNKNCLVIRFEDLHKNLITAFKDLLSRAGLLNPLIPLSENDFKHAAYLGSFEYQTKGKLKRGQSHLWNLQSHRPVSTCRKGITGDWRSSFTKEAVDRFKSLTDDKLVKLGYEKSTNWEL